MDRCWLKGTQGDALHAVLCAAGFNVRWLLRAVARLGLPGLLLTLFGLALYARNKAAILGALLQVPTLHSPGCPIDRYVTVNASGMDFASPALYARNLNCTVGGSPVRPQPGGFYVGWVTPDFAGPFKGEAGSESW